MTTFLALALIPWQIATAFTARVVAWLLFGSGGVRADR